MFRCQMVLCLLSASIFAFGVYLFSNAEFSVPVGLHPVDPFGTVFAVSCDSGNDLGPCYQKRKSFEK